MAQARHHDLGQAAESPKSSLADQRGGGFWSWLRPVWAHLDNVLGAIKGDRRLATLWGFGVLLLLALIVVLALGGLSPELQFAAIVVIVLVTAFLYVYTLLSLPPTGGISPAPSPVPGVERGPPNSYLSYRVAALNRTTAVPEDEIRRCVAALQTQVRCDLAPAWGVDAELAYCGPQDAPPPGWWWLELTDEPGAPEAPGYLAWRTASPTGLPVSRVFMRLVQSAGLQWTISASHALVEMLVNPRRNLAVLTEYEGELRIYTHDIADPCSAEEDAYPIGGVRVSDFVFPAWFDPEGKKPRVAKHS
jgi:hypothetical protein